MDRQNVCVLMLLLSVGCGGGNEPASVEDMGTTGGMTTQDMQTTNPLPQNDLGITPTQDLGTTPEPGVDQGTEPVDQGTDPQDQGSTDMTGEDMPGDMTEMDQGEDQGSGEPMCGNGVLEPGELCDGDCPMSCDDGNACTEDIAAGSSNTCNLVCSHMDMGLACGADDGCCPAGCGQDEDVDCQIDLADLDCRDPSTWPTQWKQREDELFAEVNLRRTMGGNCGADMHPMAAPLVMNDALREAARCHALDMAVRDYFGGRSPEDESALDRAVNAGYMGAISIGQDISTRAEVVMMVDNWLTIQGNCNHILNARYDDSGVGYVESSSSMYPRYWVQVVADKP